MEEISKIVFVLATIGSPSNLPSLKWFQIFSLTVAATFEKLSKNLKKKFPREKLQELSVFNSVNYPFV